MEKPSLYRWTFLVLVVLCLTQVTWWVYFIYEQSDRTEKQDRERLEARCYQAAWQLGKLGRSVHSTEELDQILRKDYPELRTFHSLRKPSDDAGALVAEVRSRRKGYFLVRPDPKALERILSERARTRRMFASEGITISLVVLAGVFLIRMFALRELRLRRQHERFLAGATHELKTPLATLRLGLQTIERGTFPPEKTKHYLMQMIEQVDRLEMEFTNLLRSATGGERRLAKDRGDLTQDVIDVAGEFHERFGAYGIKLEVQGGQEALFAARDAAAFKQVLRNLLDNACKYSPRGGRIRVSIGHTEKAVTIAVEDQGPGVPADEREHIFEKFYRSSCQSTESRGGTGLGLYLSRKTIQEHGGDLAYVDRDEAGACFLLTLPLSSKGASPEGRGNS